MSTIYDPRTGRGAASRVGRQAGWAGGMQDLERVNRLEAIEAAKEKAKKEAKRESRTQAQGEELNRLERIQTGVMTVEDAMTELRTLRDIEKAETTPTPDYEQPKHIGQLVVKEVATS